MAIAILLGVVAMFSLNMPQFNIARQPERLYEVAGRELNKPQAAGGIAQTTLTTIAATACII